jgi:lysyl-tRNA synthetase, class II
MPCVGPRLAPVRLRRLASVAILLLALESVLYGLAEPALTDRGGWVLPGSFIALDAPAGARIVALVVGLALLALMPRVWRGTRTALGLTVAALSALGVLNAAHGRFVMAGVQAALAVTLVLARRAFPLGCTNRPRARILVAALGAWALAAVALVTAVLLARTTGHVIAHVLRPGVLHGATRLGAGWSSLIEVLVAGALATTVLALRSAVSPARSPNAHTEHEYRTARSIVDAHATDSLSPFLLRPDKALAFAAGGVLSYRVIGGTAVVSADPVAPGHGADDVLAGFRAYAHRQGWQIAVWAASERHLNAYRRLGLRAVCVGEEAFVDPAGFTLEGRAVRKLRQSVHRVARRGWEIVVRDGREVDAALEREIEALAERWRRDHPRLHGFAMGRGDYAGELRPDDLYVLARSPEGDLGAVMRFVAYGDSLSLDTMQRVGDTPNGLNEALVARALEVARERAIPEVSLNYAGLAHLVRAEPSGRRWRRALVRMAMAPLHRRFQMDRLVRFNDKFDPQWRRRYLLYESRSALPRAVIRVLQAEGYLPHPRPSSLLVRLPRALPRPVADRPRQRGALSEPR